MAHSSGLLSGRGHLSQPNHYWAPLRIYRTKDAAAFAKLSTPEPTFVSLRFHAVVVKTELKPWAFTRKRCRVNVASERWNNLLINRLGFWTACSRSNIMAKNATCSSPFWGFGLLVGQNQQYICFGLVYWRCWFGAQTFFPPMILYWSVLSHRWRTLTCQSDLHTMHRKLQAPFRLLTAARQLRLGEQNRPAGGVRLCFTLAQ